MIEKVLIVTGLPGSGKTMFAQSRINAVTALVDDPKCMADFEVGEDITEIVITDPFMVDPDIRESAIPQLQRMFGDCQIDFVFFENDPDACIVNDNRRNRAKKSTETIRRLSKAYVIPDDIIPLPVWKDKAGKE
jgi:adenylate kinase